MTAWLTDEATHRTGIREHGTELFALLRDHTSQQAAQVTAEGAAWLAEASGHARSLLGRWRARPDAPVVLPCGNTFDVVSVPALFGRRMLERLWGEGPGSGPVATHRGRMLLFAAPGTAHRLPSLLAWEEWGTGPAPEDDTHRSVPSVLCHGRGDAVTVPPLAGESTAGPRWLVAPDTRAPWLPGPDALLWACVRAARTTGRRLEP